MPTDHKILGFSNRWYMEAFASSINIEPEKGYSFRILRPEYFIATKLEAFKGRGKGDGRTSSDFEDIIYVLNNRPSIWNEISRSGNALRTYFIKSFSDWLRLPYLEEWISSNLEYHESGRINYILAGIKGFVDMK